MTTTICLIIATILLFAWIYFESIDAPVYNNDDVPMPDGYAELNKESLKNREFISNCNEEDHDFTKNLN